MAGTSGAAHMFPDADETVSYLVEMPRDDWDDWKREIPRDKPLYERLHTLVQMDTAFQGDLAIVAQAEGEDAAAKKLSKATTSELRLIVMKFGRIDQRAKNAQQWLEEGDMGKLRQEVEAIRDIAGLFE